MTNKDLERFAKNIPYFRGVFMRNALPKKPKFNECAIINLDDVKNPGTHWTAYIKCGNRVFYYDSFGDLRPPKELVKYFGGNVIILYNYKQFQKFNTYTCGHLCLKFLINGNAAIQAGALCR